MDNFDDGVIDPLTPIIGSSPGFRSLPVSSFDHVEAWIMMSRAAITCHKYFTWRFTAPLMPMAYAAGAGSINK